MTSEERAPPPDADPALPPGPAPEGDAIYDEEPEQHVPGSFLSALPQFFVFPAILVATLLGVYLVLRMLWGAESDSAAELLQQVRTAGPHERWQVLHTLADGLRRKTLDLEQVPSADLADLYESYADEGRDAEERATLRGYLLQIVAHKHDPSLTHLALEALDDPDAQVRNNALIALAIMRDPAALEAARHELEAGTDDERLLALGVLGNLEGPDARDVLAGLLRDHDTIVARNAVLLLARAGDARATPFLLHMLERDSYAGDVQLDGTLRDVQDESSRRSVRDAAVESFLVAACQAAAALGDAAAVPLLRDLREGDLPLKVKSAAIDALHDLGAASES